jgi:Kef-type K+ transport system membrane component KefB
MTSSLLALLPFQIGLVLLTAHGLGLLAVRLGQPRLIGQMAAGLVLGPSVLGTLWPEAHRLLFLPTLTPLLALLGQGGLALFMFGMGLEFCLRGRGELFPRAVRITASGFMLPFLLGCALALVLLERGEVYFGAVSPLVATCFLGLALAVTAFPVLARMLQEYGLSRSSLGVLVLLSASLGDGAAWILLTVILALLDMGSLGMGSLGSGPQSLALEVSFIVLYLGFIVLGVRPLLNWLWPRVRVTLQPYVVLTLLFLSVYFSEKVGLHVVLGAFLFGLVAGGTVAGRTVAEHTVVGSSRITSHPLKPLEPLTLNLLLPLYFAYAGLGVTLTQLSEPSAWGLLLMIVFLASLGKVGGCFWAARALKMTVPVALAVGVLMNTRGLMELVLLHIGFERGIISQKLYTLMVLMTLITTALTPPLFTALRRRFPQLEVD